MRWEEEGKTWKAWNWVVELCCTVRADWSAERWRFSAMVASDGGADSGDVSPSEEDDESAFAIVG